MTDSDGHDQFDELLSMEKLDRASPDLWPEKSKQSKNVFTFLLLFCLFFDFFISFKNF